jgi:deazaflavin-dependent oxidoreductase (nitroreductase family)
VGELIDSRAGWIGDHLRLYRRTGGREGHFVDTRDMGGPEFTPTLLLKTIGRKSGQPSIVPLLYGLWRDALVIAASNGGADEHPAWYLNLRERPDLALQIATDIFAGTWRQAVGAERAAAWDYLVALYPPYADYQKATTREIPVVLLRRAERIATL